MLNYAKKKETSEVLERDKVRSELQKRLQKVVQFSSIAGLMQLFSVVAILIVFVGFVEIHRWFCVTLVFRGTIFYHSLLAAWKKINK